MLELFGDPDSGKADRHAIRIDRIERIKLSRVTGTTVRACSTICGSVPLRELRRGAGETVSGAHVTGDCPHVVGGFRIRLRRADLIGTRETNSRRMRGVRPSIPKRAWKLKCGLSIAMASQAPASPTGLVEARLDVLDLVPGVTLERGFATSERARK